MKNLKKATAIVLSATMIMSSSTFAFANESVGDYQIIKAYDVEQSYENSLQSNIGLIKNIINIDNTVQISMVIKNMDEAESEVVLNISDDTVFIDNETGAPVSIDTLKEGDKICAYYSRNMTKSLPPQSAASYIITNILEEKAIAKPLTVSEITKNEDGSIKVLSDDNMYLITIIPDNPISAFMTKQIVTIDDIKIGSRIFVWFDIMTLSLPAQSASDKTVVLPEINNIQDDSIKDTYIEAPKMIEINGNALNLGNNEIFLENGNIMVPLRAVSEALGYEVNWNNETKTVDIDNGVVKTSVQIGLDSYYKSSSKALGLTAPLNYGASPVIVNGNTYVPINLFDLLSQESITILNDKISINNK